VRITLSHVIRTMHKRRNYYNVIAASIARTHQRNNKILLIM